jgi:hypothetical protein
MKEIWHSEEQVIRDLNRAELVCRRQICVLSMGSE